MYHIYIYLQRVSQKCMYKYEQEKQNTMNSVLITQRLHFVCLKDREKEVRVIQYWEWTGKKMQG